MEDEELISVCVFGEKPFTPKIKLCELTKSTYKLNGLERYYGKMYPDPASLKAASSGPYANKKGYRVILKVVKIEPIAYGKGSKQKEIEDVQNY